MFRRHGWVSVVVILVVAAVAAGGCSAPTRAWRYTFTEPQGSLPDQAWKPTVGTGWDNGIQNYVAHGSTLTGDGHLAITARRQPDGSWTSGRVTTRDSHLITYGTVEARLRLPSGQGLWPAFWLVGQQDDTWPACGEIDILEAINQATEGYATIHGPGGTEVRGSYHKQLPPMALTPGWHTYGVTRTPGRITFTKDGQTIGTLTPANVPPGGWVFDDQPMFVVLNVAVGGPWPGPPDASTPTTASMLVDWVRFLPAG
jgi:beta-glucanase (GH16 family)